MCSLRAPPRGCRSSYRSLFRPTSLDQMYTLLIFCSNECRVSLMPGVCKRPLPASRVCRLSSPTYPDKLRLPWHAVHRVG